MVLKPENDDSSGDTDADSGDSSGDSSGDDSGDNSGDSGHTRITNSDHFITVGGDKDEHSKITEISLRVEEGLKKDRKQPHEISMDEFADRLGDAIEKTG